MAGVIDSWGIWDCIERVGRYVGARHPDAYTAGFSTSLSSFYADGTCDNFSTEASFLFLQFWGSSACKRKNRRRDRSSFAHTRAHSIAFDMSAIYRYRPCQEKIFRYTIYSPNNLAPWHSLGFDCFADSE